MKYTTRKATIKTDRGTFYHSRITYENGHLVYLDGVEQDIAIVKTGKWWQLVYVPQNVLLLPDLLEMPIGEVRKLAYKVNHLMKTYNANLVVDEVIALRNKIRELYREFST